LATYCRAHTPWYGLPYDPYLELAKYFRAHTPWYRSPYSELAKYFHAHTHGMVHRTSDILNQGAILRTHTSPIFIEEFN